MEELIKFFSYEVFYDNCEEIKKYYKQLDREGKKIFRSNFESNKLVKESHKEIQWDYLNGAISKEQLHRTYNKGKVWIVVND